MSTTAPANPFFLHCQPAAREGHVVASFTVREALSAPYKLTALALARPPVAAADLPAPGLPATLVLLPDPDAFDPAPRLVHGLVAGIEVVSIDRGLNGTWLEVTVEPRFATLRASRRRRIFQHMTVRDVASKVLREWDVPHRFELATSLPELGYCVQYDESDFDFVHRILAEHGIFYYFEHATADPGTDGARETVVFCDDVRDYPALALPGEDAPRVLKLSDREGTYRPVEAILGFRFQWAPTPTAARMRQYEFRTPRQCAEAAARDDREPARGTERPLWDEFLDRAGHDARSVSPRDARTTLEQLRADATRAAGRSDCRTLAPGRRFELDGHDMPEMNRIWVITEVEHEGRSVRWLPPAPGAPTLTYINTFRCAPADVPVRPPRRPKPVQQAAEVAVVVGPAGEEIHTDEHGRIKVQFPWDRDGRLDDKSSCWVRVAQPWAGAGFGIEFVPRIGMEVVVTFLGGDVDAPLVTGCVYNGLDAPPYALPSSKSKQVLRTQSTPGGGGYNELSFEDAAGSELVHLHAQRNLDVRVRQDEHRNVGHHRTTDVGGCESLHVGAEYNVAIRGNARVHVTVSSTEHVTRNKTVTVEHNAATHVRGDARLAVGKEYRAEVAGAARVVVGHEGGVSPAELRVHGPLRGYVGKLLELRAEEGITFRCGESVIEIKPDSVRIASPSVLVHGTDSATVVGNGPKLALTDQALLKGSEVRVAGSGGLLKLAGDAELRGSEVRLAGPGSAGGGGGPDAAQDDRVPLRLTVLDTAHRPLATRKYVLEVLGEKIEGTTDTSGALEARVPAAADMADLEVFLDDPPGEHTLRFDLRITPAPDDAATPRGAQQRLAALGYYHGRAHGRLDAGTRRALREFQHANKLAPTARLDAATQSKLAELYGQ